MSIVDSIIQSIRQTVNNNNFLALHEPRFGGNEWNYTKECLDTGWVSSVGKYVDKFEHDLAQFTGAKYAIATVNGTAALHISYLLAGIAKEDEVLVPTMTFVATVNALSYCGAIPHFIDAEEKSFGIDANLLDRYLNDIVVKENNVSINRITKRPIRALCVMHTLGHPVDLDALEEVCKKYSLILIEDAAEALGSYYKGVHVGHRGLVGTLSFNGNKVITTGGGGAILTNNTELAKRAKHLTTTAKLPHAWEFLHDEVGFNYRLPNINAAIGCAQLEQILSYLKAKRLLAETYQSALENISGIKFVKEPNYAKSNYWLNAILLDESSEHLRNDLLEAFNKNNIMTRPLWNLQHTLPMYRHCPHMPLHIAEKLQKRLIKIPSSVSLGMSVIKNRQHEENVLEVN